MKGYQENDGSSRNRVLIKAFVAINLPRLPSSFSSSSPPSFWDNS